MLLYCIATVAANGGDNDDADADAGCVYQRLSAWFADNLLLLAAALEALEARDLSNRQTDRQTRARFRECYLN